MHNNYFLFETQVNWLNKFCTDAVIRECFTHRKSELVLRIETDKEYFLRCGISAALPYLVVYPAQKVNQNYTTFFKELQDLSITQFHIQKPDKYVILKTRTCQLHFRFFGSRPNIALFDENEKLIQTFKQERKEWQLPRDFSMVGLPKKSSRLTDCLAFVLHHRAGFNKTLSREVCYRAGVDTAANVPKLDESVKNTINHTANLVESELGEPDPKIYHNSASVILSSISLKHLESNYKSESFDSVNSAWKEFLYRRQRVEEFNRLHKQVDDQLGKRIRSLEKTLEMQEKHEDLEQRKSLSELKGNLLLANLKDIKTGLTKITLKNIFSQKQEELTISLNPELSVQENAVKYLSRFKDIRHLKQAHQIRKNTVKSELNDLYTLQNKFLKVNDPENLKKIYDELVRRHIIQDQPGNQKSKINSEFDFKKLVLGGKWEIFIGKNGQNNDDLTFRFAGKNDIWMHAQGVPGAHVVLRMANSNSQPPPAILNQTAAIAAFNSNSKHSGMVPVIYTEVRYVRRIRKALPGTVKVEREKVLFVEPQNLG